MAPSQGMISAGMSCQLIHYTHEEHDKFFELCKQFDFIIVRCNPGPVVPFLKIIEWWACINVYVEQIPRMQIALLCPAPWWILVSRGQIKADGGDQQKFDDGMRAMRKAGKQVWPSPDVMEKMGAKDALCKVCCSQKQFQARTCCKVLWYCIVQGLLLPCALVLRLQLWTLVWRTHWHITLLKSLPLVSKKLWHSSRASSSKIAALLERAFGLSSSKRSVLAGTWPNGTTWSLWVSVLLCLCEPGPRAKQT